MSRKLNDWLSSYLKLVDNSEPPTLFKMWAGVSTICAVLQRKCFMQTSLWEKIYPNMYVVLVGPSSCRKGTAMGPSRYFLRGLGVKMAAEAITREALIREIANSMEIDSNGDNMTTHCSLTVFSEELTVFLGQNNWQLMSDLNNWFDCLEVWTYRTKHQGEDEIPGVWVNLFGATTPEFIQSALPQDAIGGGLASRIVFVYGDKKSKICADQSFTAEEIALQKTLQEDLEKIMMLRGEFTRTDEYKRLYVGWYEEQEKSPKFMDGSLVGYNGRRALHVRKLSMVMCASRGSDMTLRGEDFLRAKALMEETEKYMHFVFSGRGRLPTAQILDKIVRLLVVTGSISGQDLMAKFYKDITHDELMSMVKTIEKSGIGIVTYAKNDFTIKLNKEFLKSQGHTLSQPSDEPRL